MAPQTSGSASDPNYRSARARKAAYARHSIDTYIDSIVARAPELSQAQRDKLAPLFQNPANRSDGAAGDTRE